MINTQKTGKQGENVAVDYLLQNGFKILHTNWRFGHKEIDIVASKNNILHVVEVKTRSSNFWGEPKSSVIRRKQLNIIAATDAYIRQYNIDMETQFDIISVIWDGAVSRVEYIPEAFSPTM